MAGSFTSIFGLLFLFSDPTLDAPHGLERLLFRKLGRQKWRQKIEGRNQSAALWVSSIEGKATAGLLDIADEPLAKHCPE